MKTILLIILCILVYSVGKYAGEKETLENIKAHMKYSKSWNEFKEKFSVYLNEYNIGE